MGIPDADLVGSPVSLTRRTRGGRRYDPWPFRRAYRDDTTRNLHGWDRLTHAERNMLRKMYRLARTYDTVFVARLRCFDATGQALLDHINDNSKDTR